MISFGNRYLSRSQHHESIRMDIESHGFSHRHHFCFLADIDCDLFARNHPKQAHLSPHTAAFLCSHRQWTCHTELNMFSNLLCMVNTDLCYLHFCLIHPYLGKGNPKIYIFDPVLKKNDFIRDTVSHFKIPVHRSKRHNDDQNSQQT